jgi:FtsP/CotA-like multicopper oxidase with cupredoxin domain
MAEEGTKERQSIREGRVRLGILGAVAGFAVAAAFGIGLLSMAVFLRGDSPEAEVQGAAQTQVLSVSLRDLAIEPETLETPSGPITVEVTNDGQAVHNFAIGEHATPMLDPGEAATLRVPSLEPGTYEFFCQVPGHADAGMRGTLTVGEVGEEAAPISAEEMAAQDAEVTSQFPAETEGRGGRVLQPEIASGGVKVFELTAAPIQWETEPGKVLEAWAYNGTVPGPTIQADLGDRVRIVLQNELPEPTTIHFHGMTVPAEMDGVPVISQDAVLPGESFTYEFTVRNSGTNMYHSHFNAQKQVPMGLLGGFIVRDPQDPKVEVDYSMVLNDGPLGFTLNGKGFPATEPIVAKLGQTVRVRYMNEGLLIHPMHLHGLAQRVIAVDGHVLKDPYEADTVMVAPGQRVDVLVRATEAGPWALHCHILNHAESEQGMFGMVTAVIVE